MASRAFTRAPAEEAFLTAIAIAQQQKARGFELHAALSLAKLYQSTGRRRRREVLSCTRRCRWQSFTNRPVAPPMHTPFSLRRSNGFRRRPNFLRSRKRKRCSQRCRREPIKGGGDFRNWHNAEVELCPS